MSEWFPTAIHAQQKQIRIEAARYATLTNAVETMEFLTDIASEWFSQALIDGQIDATGHDSNAEMAILLATAKTEGVH